MIVHYPEHELVERQHRDRRQILPAEGNAGCERRGEQVRQGDDDLVRVVARVLDVEEALAAGAARLVDHHHRRLHQVVLGHDALDRARHQVGAAAGAGRNDELDRPGRLPLGLCWRGVNAPAMPEPPPLRRVRCALSVISLCLLLCPPTVLVLSACCFGRIGKAAAEHAAASQDCFSACARPCLLAGIYTNCNA